MYTNGEEKEIANFVLNVFTLFNNILAWVLLTYESLLGIFIGYWTFFYVFCKEKW